MLDVRLVLGLFELLTYLNRSRPLRQLNVTTTIAAPMTTTASRATTAPAPMTTRPNSCYHIVSNDSCAIPQIPIMIGHRPITHHNNKNDLNMCGTSTAGRNLIRVQTNKWDLPTIINTNIRGAGKLHEIKVIKDNYGIDITITVI